MKKETGKKATVSKPVDKSTTRSGKKVAVKEGGTTSYVGQDWGVRGSGKSKGVESDTPPQKVRVPRPRPTGEKAAAPKIEVPKPRVKTAPRIPIPMSKIEARKERQEVRRAFLSAVTKRINEVMPTFSDRFAHMRPLFVVDVNNPDCVEVSIYASGYVEGWKPFQLSNRELYGKRKFWGYLAALPRGQRKGSVMGFVREQRIKHQQSFYGENLLMTIQVDTVGLLKQYDRIHDIFSDYEEK